jgi:type I restriction enzyme S subunit
MMAFPTIELSEVASFVRGITFRPEDVCALDQKDAVACMRTKNIQAELGLSDVWAVHKDLVKREEQFLREGDILVSTANSWNLVGKCCWTPELPWPATLGGFISALRGNPTKIFPRFLYHWFNSPPTQALVRNCGRQTTNISNLSIERCLAIKLPVPTLTEQRRIAMILDQADSLRAKRHLALNRLDALTQSVFLDTFGDPATNPKGWDQRALADIGRVITGNTPSRDIPEFFGDCIEWIKSDNLNTPHHFLSKAEEGLSQEGKRVARIAPPGSVLVTCIAGSPSCIGNAAIANREVAFNQQINALVPTDPSDTCFLYVQFLVGKKLIQKESTSGMKGMVNKSRFEGIKFLWPPQWKRHHFGRSFLKLNELREKQVISATNLNALFASLQYHAFNGKL